MDFSQNVPLAGPLEKGKRRGKIMRGESRKRGCLCHFTVRIADGGESSIAELRMYYSDHRNAAGAACHEGLKWSQQGHTRKRQRPTPQKAAGPVSETPC